MTEFRKGVASAAFKVRNCGLTGLAPHASAFWSHMRPLKPAMGSPCPIVPLHACSPMWETQRPTAPISMGSPSFVPVPCASSWSRADAVDVSDRSVDRNRDSCAMPFGDQYAKILRIRLLGRPEAARRREVEAQKKQTTLPGEGEEEEKVSRLQWVETRLRVQGFGQDSMVAGDLVGV